MSTSTGTTAPAARDRESGPVPRRRIGDALAGTVTLVRFQLRRDRVRIPVWLAAISGTVVGGAAGFEDFFADDAEVAARVALIQGNPAGVALTGPGYGLENASLDNLGPLVASELSATVAVLVALMSIFLVVRHTRAEEESGRAELVRAGVVGRHAATTATLTVVGGTNVVLGGFLAVGLAALGLPWAGSLAFGASTAALGLLFAAVGALTAQLTEYARGAAGLAGALFGVVFALRAVGDSMDNDLSWYSPVGWAQAVRPYADERWWPLLLLAGLTVLVGAGAYALSVRRDLGAGLTSTRPGRAHATALLASPFGLAFRLQRGSLAGWGAGLFAGGVTGGLIAGEEAGMLDEIEIYQEIVRTGSGDITDNVLGFYFLFMAMLAGGYALQAVLRARGEETSGRAEPVLAAAVARWRWAGGHLLTALVGTAAVLALGGLGAGLARAADSGAGEIPRLVGAQLVHLPALLLLIGLSFALFGLAPRAAPLVWAVLGYGFLVSMFGPLLDLPEWLNDLSPFEHVPQLPGADPAVAPLVALSASGIGLMLVGLAAFQRRDVESS